MAQIPAVEWPGPGIVLTLIGLHLAAACAAPYLARHIGRKVLYVVALAPAATLVWALTAAGGILDGDPVREKLAWAPDLGFELTVAVDAMSLVMVLLVSGIGLAVFAFGAAYFGPRADMGRLAGLLVAFAGVMLGLVVSDNILAIFLFWEATSVLSYLLIGLDDRESSARAAALRALLTTGSGGLAMFGGLVVLAVVGDTWSLSELLAAPPGGTAVEVALVAILLGAFTKSAQVPFHFWLPGAMAAPTPVSAYLHSATMVKAGVYLIARLSPTFSEIGWWSPLVVTVGLATMIFGGWRALSQTDLKLLLAQGTVSQLGFMVALFGTGTEAGALAGVTLLLAHGIFKATMFMVVGTVDHSAGTRDLRRLDGLARPLAPVLAVAVLASASMAGIPPLFGFVAKEAAYESGLDGSGLWGTVALVAMVFGAILTFLYSARVLWGAFGKKAGDELGEEPVTTLEHPPGVDILAPAVVLSVLTVVLGLVPGLLDRLVGGAVHVLVDDAHDVHLALWHGLNAALGLTVVTIGVGLLGWRGRRGVAKVQRRLRVLPRASAGFDRTLAGLLRVADGVTGRVQNGSLPVYLMVILTTAVAVPAIALTTSGDMSADLVAFDDPVQVAVVAVMVVAVLGAVLTEHRLAAALSVGAVGYGVAGLFMLQGAPDLALTQLIVETMVLVVYVLVLRHLPRRFTGGTTALPVLPRAMLAVLVGVVGATLAVVAISSRPDVEPVSVEHLARAESEAHSHNVVNAILVDFRAWDTMGEIAVLTVTALGVIGLVRAAYRERIKTRTQVELDPFRRSPILDAAGRTLLRTVLLLSVVMLAVGHNHPGGGFIGGLVAGAAFMVIYLAGGHAALRRSQPLAPEVFLGLGVAVAVLTGVSGLTSGEAFLDTWSWSVELPVVGVLEVTSALVFDLGVYLVVLGLVLALLRSLGREEVQQL